MRAHKHSGFMSPHKTRQHHYNHVSFAGFWMSTESKLVDFQNVNNQRAKSLLVCIDLPIFASQISTQ